MLVPAGTAVRFTMPAICQEELDNYRREMNPARSFLTENYHAEPAEQIPTAEIYKRYRTWCLENGYRPLGERTFGKEVRRTFPNVDRAFAGGRANRHRVYVGIGDGPDEPALGTEDAGRAPCEPCEPSPQLRSKGPEIGPIGPKRGVSKGGSGGHGAHGAHGAHPGTPGQDDPTRPDAEVVHRSEDGPDGGGTSSPSDAAEPAPAEEIVDLWPEEDDDA